jgi:hypothetical protein
MKLISHSELHNHEDHELDALFNHVSQFLITTDPHTHERRNALASLENINRARSLRFE